MNLNKAGEYVQSMCGGLSESVWGYVKIPERYVKIQRQKNRATVKI